MSNDVGMRVMSDADVAAYRLHAAMCLEIAHETADPERKFALLNMAQTWLALAEHSTRLATFLVQRAPSPDAGQERQSD